MNTVTSTLFQKCLRDVTLFIGTITHQSLAHSHSCNIKPQRKLVWYWYDISSTISISWVFHLTTEAVARRCSLMSVMGNFAKFLKIKTSEAWNFIKQETPLQVFSCYFCEIFRKTFFMKHLGGCFCHYKEKLLTHGTVK